MLDIASDLKGEESNEGNSEQSVIHYPSNLETILEGESRQDWHPALQVPASSVQTNVCHISKCIASI